MDIVAFLKKDMVDFLENSVKPGTPEYVDVEDALLAQLRPVMPLPTASTLPETSSLPEPEFNLANESVQNAISQVSDGNTLKSASPEELIIIQKSIDELNSDVADSNLKNTLNLYNQLKTLVSTVNLSSDVQFNLYTALKDAALFLQKNKLENYQLRLEETSQKQKEKINSLEEHEKEHESTSITNTDIENTDTFHMPSYVNALKAIREHDKVTALELLVSLSKKHPKNMAIKLRLKEALSL